MKDEQPKMNTYEVPGVYGKTDLTSTSPWSSTSHGWGATWNPAFDDVTEESYNRDPEAYRIRVANKNADYIEQLKREGKYLKPFVNKISMIHNPLFDGPPKGHYFDAPLESHRMVILDTDSISTNKRDEYPVHTMKSEGIRMSPEKAAPLLTDGTLIPTDEKTHIVIKDENGKPLMWCKIEEWDHYQRWDKCMEEIMFRTHFGSVKLTDAKEDEIYIRHGLTPPDRTHVPRLGNFFMAYVGDDRRTKMLWQEPDGKVYDFKEGSMHPDPENVDTTEYTGKWTYWRAVSGFDF